MRMCSGLPLGHVEVNSCFHHHHFTLYVQYCFRKARTMSYYFTVSSSITNNFVITYGFSIWLIHSFLNSFLQLFLLQLFVFLSESLWLQLTTSNAHAQILITNILQLFFVRSEEHLPTYCRSEVSQFAVSNW